MTRQNFKPAPQAEGPLRVELLNEGAKLTAGVRDSSYGDPSQNLSLAGRLKALVRSYQVRDMSPAEVEAIDMVLSKVARVYTGPEVTRDNYVDGATYFAIAGEQAIQWGRAEAAAKVEAEIQPTSQGEQELYDLATSLAPAPFPHE